MNIERVPTHTHEAGAVEIHMSASEWNALRELMCEHINATGWCQRNQLKRKLLLDIESEPRIDLTKPFPWQD